jgi:hypothetical protein
MPPFLALGGGEILKQFAGLLELARIGLIADFEDGIRQQLSTFRCCLSGCMEEIQQRVTHRPEFGQHQFGRIGEPLPGGAQSGLAQPLGDYLPRAFGGGFDLGQFVVSLVAAVLVRKLDFTSSPNGRLDCGIA